MMNDYRTVPFHKCGMIVAEWNPDEHDGQREPWESMEATMDAGWPGKLAERGLQETADPPVTERYHDPATDRRRVLRSAWTLPTDVPRDLAARCKVDVLKGHLTYEPEQS